MLPHIPNYLGTISLGSDTVSAQVAGTVLVPGDTNVDPPVRSEIGSTTVIANDWAPSNGNKIQTDLAIVLENVAHGFKRPNILDVKIGARLWANDAPVAKRAKLDKVSAATTSGSLGFRIAGMKTYDGTVGNGHNGISSSGYKIFDKEYGRTFTASNIYEGFGDYFLLAKEEKAKGAIRKVLRRFIEDLKEMQEVIEKSESRMYSASLLFVYEGDHQALQDAFAAEKDMIQFINHEAPGGLSMVSASNGSPDSHTDDDVDGEEIKFPAIQSLKLIDFAHAEWTPGQGADENFLHGIRHVIRVLQDLS